MRKNLATILTIIISVFALFAIVYAANTYPTTLNDWEDGDIIESDWADSIENEIGVTGSTVTSSLNYQVANLASLSQDETVTGEWNFTGGASFSSDLSFFNEIKPDGSTCSNNQILKKTGTNDWDCATDGGAPASNSLDFDEFVDSMTLDANLTIASTSNNYTIDFLDTRVDIADTTFLSNGNVGIGTTGPTSNLDVIGSASVSQNFEVGSNAFRVLSTGIINAGTWNGTSIADANIDDAITVNWTGLQTYPTGCSAGQFVSTIGDTLTCGTPTASAFRLEVGTEVTFAGVTSISFADSHFVISNTASQSIVKLDWGAGGPASLSEAETITGNWVNTANPWADNEVADTLTLTTITGPTSLSGNFELPSGFASASQYFGGGLVDCDANGSQLLWDTTLGVFSCQTLADADIPDTITISGGTIGSNNISAASTWTTLGTLTIGDNGDAVNFDTSTWDVSAGVFSGVAGMTGTGVYDFGGATSFEIPNAAAPTVNATGEIAIHTGSSSFDWFDGTNTIVWRNESCFAYYIESPTSSNPLSVGHKRFFDPFTITKVSSTASGSNAAGWNLQYGVPGTVTTNVFTTAKSASTSSSPIYTSFANSTVGDNNVLDVRVTSASAVLQSFTVNVCGRYNH